MTYNSQVQSAWTSAPATPLQIRVLLVEDCRLVRVGIRSVLDETACIDVIGEVDSGELAVSAARSLVPDVVLIDIGLPGMSGIETITRIDAMNLGCRFIILTSHETETEVMAAMAAGASAFCLKNISSHRLAEVIATVHEGATWLDPAVSRLTERLFRQGSSVAEFAGAGLRDRLSERELKTLCLMAAGKSNNEIAKELFISVHTAKFYVSSLLEKLNVTARVQAAVIAAKEGLI